MKAILFLMISAAFTILQARGSCVCSSRLTEPRGCCSPLRPDYQRFTGLRNAYKFHREPAIWNDARHRCAFEGAYLVIFNSDLESTTMGELFKREKTTTWFQIGIHNYFKKMEYVTIHGDPLEATGFTRWDPYDPKNVTGEYCGIANEKGDLLDWFCDRQLNYICELPCDENEGEPIRKICCFGQISDNYRTLDIFIGGSKKERYKHLDATEQIPHKWYKHHPFSMFISIQFGSQQTKPSQTDHLLQASVARDFLLLGVPFVITANFSNFENDTYLSFNETNYKIGKE